LDNLTIVILTYNEEKNLHICLRNAIKLTRKIVIIDSYSTDNTLSISQEYGCDVYQNEFVNQAVQLNWALANVNIDTEWILRLDADEYFTSELIAEFKSKLLMLDSDITGIFLRRRVFFMGKWIRFGGYYPTFILRVWRRGSAVCEQRWMDEHMCLTRGKSVTFDSDFVDDNKKNLHWWIAKHNDYATREAIEQLNYKYSLFDNDTVVPSVFGTQEQKKRWFKERVYNKFPLGIKPALYFIYRYFIRLGFLDGYRGLLFHVLQAFWYRFLVDAKVYEALKKAKYYNVDIKHVLKNEYGVDL